MEIEILKNKFCEIYGKGEIRVFIGPARVNLIGEHTDHQGGYVFPCAISLRSACLVRIRSDNRIRIAASDLPGIVEADISDLSGYGHISWGNYQLGVAHIMRQKGYKLCGMDMLFDETVPHGSGLSSSAAIEVAAAIAIATISHEQVGTPIDRVELARIAQMAENEYVGMNCGIMDQFASAMGQKDQAILLRCSDLDYHYAPIRLSQMGYTLMICNTKKPRSLVTSAYNQRRGECDEAYADLKSHVDIACLADLSLTQFYENEKYIRNPIAQKRAKHVVLENARTIQAARVLEEGNMIRFGELMHASHESLRDLFEVTGEELDAMYRACIAQKGVVGARMTGAGFGGCSIAIVENEQVAAFMAGAGESYRKQTGYTPEFYVAEITDGAREIYS